MAPSPEHDNEPKAPDKNDNKASEGVELRTNSDFLDDHLSSSVRDLDIQGSSVSTLDDGQLKALLDEAINYKTPKDREGKSRIFKVLLQEAEEDERNARAASASGPQLARYYNAAARRQRGAAGRRGTDASAAAQLTHGGSLQDLVQAGLYEVERVERCTGRRSGGGSSRRRHHHQHPVTGHRTVSVSARQREGGSLPSNVNASSLYPTDLRLFTDTPTPSHQKSKRTNSTTTNTITSQSDMVEACTESTQTPITQTSQTTQSGEPSPQRPEYTVIDLTNQDNTQIASAPSEASSTVSTATALVDISATVEETRGLLQKEARDSQRSSYNSTECLARFNRFQGGDGLQATNVEYGDGGEKEDQGMEMMATSGRRHHHSSTFDGVPRHQYFNPLEEALNPHRIPRIRYTSRASLEVDGVSGAHGGTTVDKTISFPQFQTHDGGTGSTTGATSLQLDPEYNSVKCIVEGSGTGSDSASGGGASGGRNASQSAVNVPTSLRFLSVANSKIIHGVDRFAHHAEKKGLDENGNSVTTTSLDSKKKKKCKVDRNVTVLKSENLPGHRADIIKNIDLLVKYIEEDDASSSKPKHHHTHHHKSLNSDKTGSKSLSMDSNSKKRARVKTKSEQHSTNSSVVKKSNSLEEISKTKLEDLMSEDSKTIRSRVKKQSTSEDGDRRSWAENPLEESVGMVGNTVISPETAEFHVVTKKKKSKKRTTKLFNQQTQPTTYYHYHRIEHAGAATVVPPAQNVPPGGPRDRAEPQRRKSACSVPPSDKSADSSDVDSVHSLPAETVHRREEAAAAGAHQTSPASTSYADIARTNGGQTSSASSNCSSHSSSSNQCGMPQPSAPLSAWKLSPQPIGPAAPPSLPYSPPIVHQVHIPLSLPPALRSEHFPELCGDKDTASLLAAPQNSIETCPLRFDSDFPSLGGDNLSNPTRLARAHPSGDLMAPAKARQTQTDLKLSDSVPNRTVNTAGKILRRGGSSRPAVIILDDEQNGETPPPSSDPIQVSGLTFGFELNEQLLNDSDGDSQCMSPPPRGALPAAEMFTARYVAPHVGAHLTDSYNHDKIVTFVGLAWEDVVHQTNGKVQYYNGQ